MRSGRRESVRLPNVDLLSKLSAIVRRGSLFPGDFTDEISGQGNNYDIDNNNHSPVPATSSIKESKKQEKDGEAELSADTVSTHEKSEQHQRQLLETLSFGDLHCAFDPSTAMCGGDDDEVSLMDNNELETWVESTSGLMNPHIIDAISERTDEESRGISTEEQKEDEEEEALDFDPLNMTTSVRTLMKRIASQSESREMWNASNQDEDETKDASTMDENTDEEDEDGDESDIMGKEVELEKSDIDDRGRRYFPVLEGEVQEQLTNSVRRLVIDLSDQSDLLHNELPSAHQNSRRRGNSCPAAYSPRDSLSAMQYTANRAIPPTAPRLSLPAVQRKKSGFARFAPKFLENLNFRRKRKTYLFTDEELESIEGARWKIVELAFRFGGKHRFYLVQAVNMFFPLMKYGRRGGRHPTRLHCNHCGTIQWQHKRGGMSESIDLADVVHVLDGRQTAVFRKYSTNEVLEACSFSIVFSDRTLDLETQSSSHRDWLMSAIRTLISYSRKQRKVEQRAIAERSTMTMDHTAVQPLNQSESIMVESSALA